MYKLKEIEGYIKCFHTERRLIFSNKVLLRGMMKILLHMVSPCLSEPVIQRKKKSSSQDVYPCQAYSTMEPPLQRKKRIQSFNPATLPDEYMLLGNQSKFSNNIRYKPKFTVSSAILSGVFFFKFTVDSNGPNGAKINFQ